MTPIGRHRQYSSLGAVLFALAILVLAAPAFAAPTQVLITLPPGAVAQDDFDEQLAIWRQNGTVATIHLLEAREHVNDKPGFASLALLEFDNEGAYSTWRAEADRVLKAPLRIDRVDVLAHGELTPRDSNRSIFEVKTYATLVDAKAYAGYVRDYIVPNMENQRGRRVLIRYTMYLAREAADGRPVSTLVMEYRDSVAYRKREAIKQEFEAKELASNSSWAQIGARKDGIRRDLTDTLASYSELPPPQLPDLPPYVPEVNVVGGLRIIGSELKNAVDQLAAGFMMFHPQSKPSTSHIPSSEGGIASLYLGLADVAPMGDDAKITDMMPFYNTFGYMPTEISVATGGHEKRGSLWAWAVVVSRDNPLEEISVEELVNLFGAERSGGWELVENDYRYTAKYARDKSSNIRTWDQLGLKGEYRGREIQTFGYVAPGFAIYFERNWFHWSKKWNPNFMEYVEYKQTSPGEEGAKVASTVPLEQLGRNKYAIGLAGLMHVKNYPDVKVLRISRVKGGKAIPLTAESVAKRQYPLIRDAYFYVNKAPGQPLDPKVREFMRFVLSREGQEIIARVGYYYPLDAAYLAEQRAKLD